MVKAKARAGNMQFARMRNTLEMDFGVLLERMRGAGEIRAWEYEPLSLRLAQGASYKPDFLVVNNDGTLTLFETKGFWREAARVRIKVAAERFPWFEFVGVRQERGQWAYEQFNPTTEQEAKRHEREEDPQRVAEGH